MTSKNVQLVTGILSTGEEMPTFYVDKSCGRVGIGNAASLPDDDEDNSNIFHVTGNMYATRFHGDGSALTGLTDSKWLSLDNDIYYNGGDVSIGVRESGGKRLRVCESGNDILTVDGANKQTGINIFNPVASLHVNGSFINTARWNLLNTVINITDPKQEKILIHEGEYVVTDDYGRVWGMYNNVPDWLIGSLGTKYINTSRDPETFTFTTKCSITAFLINVNSINTENWEELDTYSDILNINGSPRAHKQACKIYVKTFTVGTYVLNSSALYAFIL